MYAFYFSPPETQMHFLSVWRAKTETLFSLCHVKQISHSITYTSLGLVHWVQCKQIIRKQVKAVSNQWDRMLHPCRVQFQTTRVMPGMDTYEFFIHRVVNQPRLNGASFSVLWEYFFFCLLSEQNKVSHISSSEPRKCPLTCIAGGALTMSS